MSSKTSFFNKAIFKSDMRRFWWIGILETLVLILICVMPVYDVSLRHGSGFGSRPNWDVGFIVLIIFGMGTAVTQFSYLNSSAPVSTLHSFPTTRTELFVTKLVSATVLMVIPIIINGLIFTFMSFSPIFFFTIIDVAKWIGIGLIYLYLMFSLATFTSMMTGNSVATLIFTIGFSLLPLLLYSLLDIIFSDALYGYVSMDFNNTLMENIYIGPSGLEKGEYLWNYPIASIALLVLAYLMYRKRKLESHGEVIAFRWLKPVFTGIVASLASGLSYAYFNEFLQIKSLFAILPLGIIGTIISYMVAKKSIDFKGALKATGYYILGGLIFIAVLFFDLTGYETRIPKISDIKYVSVNTPNSKYYQNEHYNYRPFTFDEEADFENTTDVHSYFIANEGRNISANRWITLRYTLKNGSVLERKYPISVENDAPVVRKIIETKGFRQSIFAAVNSHQKTYMAIAFNDRRLENAKILYPDNTDMKKLLDAIKKDMNSISFEEIFSPATSSSVKLEWKQNNTEYQTITASEDFDLSENTPNTNKALEEIWGTIPLPTDDDVESIDVISYHHRGDNGKITITEKDEISEIYSMYDVMVKDNYYENFEEINMVELQYTLKNGHTFFVSCNYSEEDMPDIFKSILKTQ